MFYINVRQQILRIADNLPGKMMWIQGRSVVNTVAIL
jgi:hypothetical protein